MLQFYLDKKCNTFQMFVLPSCLFIMEIFTFHKFASMNMVRKKSYYCSGQVVETEK